MFVPFFYSMSNIDCQRGMHASFTSLHPTRSLDFSEIETSENSGERITANRSVEKFKDVIVHFGDWTWRKKLFLTGSMIKICNQYKYRTSFS